MNEVNVFTDAGRCSRPLYIVENRALKITKHHINLLKSKMIKFKNLILGSIPSKNHTDDCAITEGVIEYVDTEESWYSMIAMNQEALKDKNITYKYCEIHPCMILGVCRFHIFHSVITISLSQNIYQSAAGKQAAGIYAQNFKKRMDTGHILNYTAKPLVNTQGRILPTAEIPSGMNVIVAIGSYSGYNQRILLSLTRVLLIGDYSVHILQNIQG